MDSLHSLLAHDRFSQHCGLELLHAGAGRAKVRLAVQPHHLNGVHIVHGGAIFTLADFTFGAAANSHGFPAVTINSSIAFMKAVRGGTLYAEAEEVSRTRRLGAYTVTVTDEPGDIVAIFQGLAYRKNSFPTGR